MEISMGEWQPVNMAPTDGTLIIGVWEDFDFKNIAGSSMWFFPKTTFFSDNHWHTYNSFSEKTRCRAPTYWMPLPKPPR